PRRAVVGRLKGSSLWSLDEFEASASDRKMPDVGPVAIATTFPWPALLWSLAIAVGAVLLLLPMARRTGWMDRPDSRKPHQGEIPLIGGWAAMLAIFLVQFNGPAPSRATTGYWIGALALFATSL